MDSLQFFLCRLIAGLRAAQLEDEGVTAIEYGLIAALIAVVIIAVVSLVGGELQTTFETIQTALENANTDGGGGS